MGVNLNSMDKLVNDLCTIDLSSFTVESNFHVEVLYGQIIQ